MARAHGRRRWRPIRRRWPWVPASSIRAAMVGRDGPGARRRTSRCSIAGSRSSTDRGVPKARNLGGGEDPLGGAADHARGPRGNRRLPPRAAHRVRRRRRLQPGLRLRQRGHRPVPEAARRGRPDPLRATAPPSGTTSRPREYEEEVGDPPRAPAREPSAAHRPLGAADRARGAVRPAGGRGALVGAAAARGDHADPRRPLRGLGRLVHRARAGRRARRARLAGQLPRANRRSLVPAGSDGGTSSSRSSTPSTSGASLRGS